MLNEQYEIDTVELNLTDGMYDLLGSMSSAIEEKIHTYYRKVRLADVGLDPRGGYDFWVDTQHKECVVINRGNKRVFDYYCGGEYVNDEDVCVIGDYAIYYNNDDSRVEGWIEAAIDATNS